MWKLTPEYCASINNQKKDNVIFTLTDYKKDYYADRAMIEVLRKNYNHISFWIQGIHDLEYLSQLTNTDDIKILSPNLETYHRALCVENTEYVGTRLHAGIFAMRHGVRSLMIRVDKRMDAMSRCIPNNTISRTEIVDLNGKINSSFETVCELDWKGIEQWKAQFN